jgi:hypothetical protein
MPAGAMALTAAFTKSGYLVPLLGATQALVGALLVSNRFVPLALTIAERRGWSWPRSVPTRVAAELLSGDRADNAPPGNYVGQRPY